MRLHDVSIVVQLTSLRLRVYVCGVFTVLR